MIGASVIVDGEFEAFVAEITDDDFVIVVSESTGRRYKVTKDQIEFTPDEIERMRDEEAVSTFTQRMADKMAASRRKGRHGWWNPAICPIERLRDELVKHVEKEDWVDVANYAMMLHWRHENEQ